ncbi:MAG: META domain-containing protein [Paracoccus denitrificans]|uniref:META domain-containing protein n=1 Tax=Paracoccus denitrificans TaxID=266 RepID=A0A533IDS8_PARDE|nr:MAG: META domain-containing protein [Paracoccus denitrificans]
MKYSSLAACAGAVLIMAGCATDQGPAAPGATFDGTYRLVSIDSNAIPGSADLTIDGQAIHGQGPCNLYNAQNNANWPQISLTAIASTRRACRIEGGEAAFLAALGQVSQASRTGNTLELSGPVHRLRFTVE